MIELSLKARQNSHRKTRFWVAEPVFLMLSPEIWLTVAKNAIWRTRGRLKKKVLGQKRLILSLAKVHSQQKCFLLMFLRCWYVKG